jgi:riboflavin synthase
MKISMESIDPDTIVSKGSVTIEGVSLTIAAVENTWFEVALIPTTETTTTLGNLAEGEKVNVETDILARTIAHVVRRMK